MRSPQEKNKYTFSYFHLLISCYLLVLFVSSAWYITEGRDEYSLWEVNSTLLSSTQDGEVELTMRGENFHESIRGYYIDRLISQPLPDNPLLPGASIKAVEVTESLALVACYQRKLVSIDLTNPKRPVVAGSVDLPANIGGVLIAGNRALVTMTRNAGIAIVDLSNSEHMTIVAHIPVEGYVSDMVLAGDWVYYVNVYEGLGRIRIDVDTPTPELLVVLEKPWRLSISKEVIAVGALNGTLTLLAYDQEGKVENFQQYPHRSDKEGSIRDIAFLQDTLAVALEGRAVKLFKISTDMGLKLENSLDLPGAPYRIYPGSEQGHLFVTLISSGIVHIEKNLQTDKADVRHMILPATLHAVALQKDTIFYSGNGQYRGLYMANFEDVAENDFSESNFISPEHSDFYSWNGQIYAYRRDNSLLNMQLNGSAGTVVKGETLLVPDRDCVAVFEAQENADVQCLGPLDKKMVARKVIQVDDVVYVLSMDSISIYRGDNYTRMSLIGSWNTDQRLFTMGLVDRDRLMIVDSEGVKVLDVSNLSAPGLIKAIPIPTHFQSNVFANNILLHGQRAFISYGDGGVYVINVANSDNPRLQQIISTPGIAKEMIVEKDLLLVANGFLGVYLVDISDEDSARPIGTLSSPIPAKDIAVTDDTILVSSHPGGTVSLPLPKPVNSLKLLNGSELSATIEGPGHPKLIYVYDNLNNERINM